MTAIQKLYRLVSNFYGRSLYDNLKELVDCGRPFSYRVEMDIKASDICSWRANLYNKRYQYRQFALDVVGSFPIGSYDA